MIQLRTRCMQASIMLPDPPHMDNTQCTKRNQIENKNSYIGQSTLELSTIGTSGFFEWIEWLSRRLEKISNYIPYQDCWSPIATSLGSLHNDEVLTGLMTQRTRKPSKTQCRLSHLWMSQTQCELLDRRT